MRPAYIDVTVQIAADTATDLQRLHSRVGWTPDFHHACREALESGERIIDNETITRLGDLIEANHRARHAPGSYDPADVGSRFD